MRGVKNRVITEQLFVLSKGAKVRGDGQRTPFLDDTVYMFLWG